MKLNDIVSESDIKNLVDKFYEKVLIDPEIGFIFTETVEISWSDHLPIMYSFWSSLLLGTNTYKGNPMNKHIDLNEKIKLTPEHFERWLHLWETTVHENFIGDNANQAVLRAKNIASVMRHKVNS